MTVHDLGCNHNSFQEFVNSPCMTEIKERSCFIHVDVTGHSDNAESLPDSYVSSRTKYNSIVKVIPERTPFQFSISIAEDTR